MGTVNHIYWINKKSTFQILESWIRPLCSRNWKTSGISGPLLYNAQTSGSFKQMMLGNGFSAVQPTPFANHWAVLMPSCVFVCIYYPACHRSIPYGVQSQVDICWICWVSCLPANGTSSNRSLWLTCVFKTLVFQPLIIF